MMLPDTCCSQRWLSHQLNEEEPGWLSTPWWQGASTPRATGWVELAVSPQPLPCTAISFRTDTKGSSQLLRQQVIPCENIQQHVWRAHEEGEACSMGRRGRGEEGSKVPGHISMDYLGAWATPSFLPNPQGTSEEWSIPAMQAYRVNHVKGAKTRAPYTAGH